LQLACRPIPETRTIVAVARDVTAAKVRQDREHLLAEISSASGLAGTGPGGLAAAVTRVLARLVPGACFLEFSGHPPIPDARSPDSTFVHRVPVVANDVVIGVLCVRLAEGDTLEDRHKALLVEVAERLAPLVETAQLHQRLVQTAEMVDATDTGIARLSPAGRVLSWNSGAERITGISADDAIGQHLADLTGPRTALSEQLSSPTTGQGEPVHREARHFRPDGTAVWVEVSTAPITDWNGNPDGVVMTVVDISERKSAESRLEIVARTDSLTGLANRADLERSIHQALARCQGTDGGGALLFIDLDGFKEVNERLGHRVGDGVLREVGARLSKSSLIGHLPGRFGGDEFGVLVEGGARLEPDHDLVVAGQILAALAEPFTVGDQLIKLEASCGIARFPHDAADGDELFWKADAAMYAAKRHGGGHAERFRPGMEPRSPDTATEIAVLRAGMRAQEFVLYYQPVVALTDGRVMAHEALARWQSPKGVLAPDAFLNVAEDSGLIIPLGYQLIEMACTWLSGTDDGDLWLNLSRRQFAAEDLPTRLSSLLVAHSLPPQRVTVEITETTLFDDPEQARATLTSLRDLGVRVALDDFGTGYSSLGELRDLPVDSVKIDRSFVSGVDRQDAASQRAIVKAAIQMAHALGLTVVAEGVESAGEEAVVRDLGCDLAQGYFYGLPSPPESTRSAEATSRRD
jgi:diguanylate cyclase (GGDEF)-like protein/PAS domain S-box-containing protein